MPIVSIQKNDDQLCISRAIVVGWAKRRVGGHNHKSRSKDQSRSHLTPPVSSVSLQNKSKTQQKELVVALYCLDGVPVDLPASLYDLASFKDVLNVWVIVVRVHLGNQFLTCAETDQPELL